VGRHPCVKNVHSLSGLPGPGDAQIPLIFHIPLYGITQYGTWRISPSGNGVSLKLLEGTWGPGGEDFDPNGYGTPAGGGSTGGGTGGGSAGRSSANKDLCRAVSK
jgi:hypothetical protein